VNAPRVAVQVPPHQLPEVQRAARLLLAHPLVTAGHPSTDALALVRRWESVLRTELDLRFGYRLDVTRTAARLLRRPGRLSPHRGAFTPSGRPFGRWTYAFACLSLAALERAGAQVLGSELVDRVETLARGDAGLPVDLTVRAQRQALVDALSWLDRLGVVTARDGTVEGLLEDRQVLFDIDRDAAAMVLVASPSVLREVTTTADFLAQPHAETSEARTRAARHRVNRRIVDSPVVYADELDDDEADLVSRNRRREAAAVELLTGCTVELRREGLALIDAPVDPIGRTAFPGTGTVAWAALVWLAALVAAARPQVDVDGSGPRTVSGPEVDRTWGEVVAEYGSRFRAEFRDDPDRLRVAVLRLLAGLDLVRPGPSDDGTVVVTPLAARFAPEVTVAEPSPPAVQQSLLEL
jgi:uncharacterized protein (TIGR02678 family)